MTQTRLSTTQIASTDKQHFLILQNGVVDPHHVITLKTFGLRSKQQGN